MRESQAGGLLGEGLLGLKRWVELPEIRQGEHHKLMGDSQGKKRVGLTGQLWGGLPNLCQEKLGATAGALRRGVRTGSVDP